MLVSMGAFDGCRTSWAARRRSQGLATQWSWTPSARDLRHAMIIERKQKRALATSSGILLFALHARVQESCGRIG